MDERPEWMKPMDRRILELLAGTREAKLQGMWIKPSGVARNIGATRSYVNGRLIELTDRGYVEKSEDKYYRITDKGVHFIKS